jgi:hypothetical protein
MFPCTRTRYTISQCLCLNTILPKAQVRSPRPAIFKASYGASIYLFSIYQGRFEHQAHGHLGTYLYIYSLESCFIYLLLFATVLNALNIMYSPYLFGICINVISHYRDLEWN